MLSKENPLESTGYNYGGEVRRYAEGGQALLAPDAAPEQEVESDPLLPLYDVLGEEGEVQLKEAMVQYPVVVDVAEMAVHRADGEVLGESTAAVDDVPARVEEGEFILPAGLVKEIGIDVLNAMLEDYHQRTGAAEAV